MIYIHKKTLIVNVVHPKLKFGQPRILIEGSGG